MDLFGRDFIVTQEWALDELMALLDLAAKMKRDRFSPLDALEHKTFYLFYNPSVRAANSGAPPPNWAGTLGSEPRIGSRLQDRWRDDRMRQGHVCTLLASASAYWRTRYPTTARAMNFCASTPIGLACPSSTWRRSSTCQAWLTRWVGPNGLAEDRTTDYVVTRAKFLLTWAAELARRGAACRGAAGRQPLCMDVTIRAARRLIWISGLCVDQASCARTVRVQDDYGSSGYQGAMSTATSVKRMPERRVQKQARPKGMTYQDGRPRLNMARTDNASLPNAGGSGHRGD
jgi:hypothetical protein